MQPEVNLNFTGKELVIRTGEAEKVFAPRKVELNGNIFAPGEFVQKRKGFLWGSDRNITEFTHVVVDYDKLSIQLVVDEDDNFAKIITGKLEYHEDFKSFGINENKNYTVRGLYSMLRLKRAYFSNREAHAALLEQLKKFEAKTEVEFKSINDFKGSTALQKIQTCKTNISYNFILNIPVFKGLPEMKFPVEIEFEPMDGSIVCWLISEDLAELEIKLRDDTMKNQLDIFKDFVVIQK